MSMFNISFKVMLTAYMLFILISVYGCSGDSSYTTTGSHSPIATGDSSVTVVTDDDDVTNEAPPPSPEAEAEGNINGCSEQSHLDGRC